MHYELYVDSLFFLNFIMNLYLLMLVNRTVLRRAGPVRLLLGAAAGAVCFLIPLLMRAPAMVKFSLGTAAGIVGMLCIPFQVRSLRMFLKLLERLLLYSFGIGGGILFLVRSLPGIRSHLTGMMGILGMGAVFFLLYGRLKGGMDMEHSLCSAVLSRDGRQVKVCALIDSGNSLVEPVSGKPVSIVSREILERLWESDREFFRAVPYHSIGKKRGILPGYLLPRLQVETEGMVSVFHDVYIAVSAEVIAETENNGLESVNMILHPGLFSGRRREGRKKRQNERQNDSESNNTRQNAV